MTKLWSMGQAEGMCDCPGHSLKRRCIPSFVPFRLPGQVVPSWAMRWQFPVKAEGEDRVPPETEIKRPLFWVSVRATYRSSWMVPFDKLGGCRNLESPLCAECCAGAWCGSGRHSYFAWGPSRTWGLQEGPSWNGLQGDDIEADPVGGAGPGQAGNRVLGRGNSGEQRT